jgi:SAM-dependent methyltransferase
MTSTNKCLLCHHEVFTKFPELSELKSVTSDCKPWGPGDTILVCSRCGQVQKQLDNQWQAEVTEIYSQYAPYSLSAGQEQPVFTGGSNANYSQARSAVILKHLSELVILPSQGTLLDVGCGNGALLKAVSSFLPQWRLAGLEQNRLHYAEIMQITGVARFYASFIEIDQKFDMITLIHVLEHISQPLSFLTELRQQLNPSGILLIQLPNLAENPFDLVVKDHCSHFTGKTLKWLVEAAGFNTMTVATDWVAKEISLVATPAKMLIPSTLFESQDVREASQLVKDNINWLQNLIKQAQEVATATPQFGIFGTAIAGSWLAGILEEKVKFFVEEDWQKVGKRYLGKPVLPLSELPKDSVVYIALPVKIAQSVYRRVQPLYSQVNFVIPI